MIDVSDLEPGETRDKLVDRHSVTVVRLRPAARIGVLRGSRLDTVTRSRALYLVVCRSCSALVADAAVDVAYAIEAHVGVARSA